MMQSGRGADRRQSAIKADGNVKDEKERTDDEQNAAKSSYQDTATLFIDVLVARRAVPKQNRADG
jgi:hypothetical protein